MEVADVPGFYFVFVSFGQFWHLGERGTHVDMK